MGAISVWVFYLRLIFLAFDMEMIFMYPWAVVFANLGTTAFADMMASGQLVPLQKWGLDR